ncbi:hypothetical protein CSUI_010458 [Cystoisospora suis]|uniref:Transmembrane protein n=1 Tax=Cystoisospora suis TaxID=483139 RepID=A0A2C6JB88_9APIC|nr:hypothetical protein CSUI_010458 [Cystoisospora suis]
MSIKSSRKAHACEQEKETKILWGGAAFLPFSVMRFFFFSLPLFLSFCFRRNTSGTAYFSRRFSLLRGTTLLSFSSVPFCVSVLPGRDFLFLFLHVCVESFLPLCELSCALLFL